MRRWGFEIGLIQFGEGLHPHHPPSSLITPKLILLPHPILNLAISSNKTALAVLLALFPEAGVVAASPDLSAKAVELVVDPEALPQVARYLAFFAADA